MVSVLIVSVRSWPTSFDRLCLDPTHMTSVLSALRWRRRAAHQLMKSAEQSDRCWRTVETSFGEELAYSCMSSVCE